MLRNGWPDWHPLWPIPAVVLWTGAFGLLLPTALRRPCTRVQVLTDGRVEVLLRYPHRVERSLMDAAGAPEAQFVESEDADGGSQLIRTRLDIPRAGSVLSVVLARGERRRRQAAARAFSRALAQARLKGRA